METETIVKKIKINQLPVLSKQLIDSATLPSLYIEAKQALVKLDRIDEIQDIANKHSAIAHYAKQIKDNSLKYYAERVYLRALRRIGEILNSLSSEEREKRKAEFDLTHKDFLDSRRVAKVPLDKFDNLLEQTPPASRSNIVAAGTNSLSVEKARERTRAMYERECQEKQPADRVLLRILETLEEDAGTASVCWAPDLKKMIKATPSQMALRCSRVDAILLRERVKRIAEELDEIDRALEIVINRIHQ
jgi:hypothetical protein